MPLNVASRGFSGLKMGNLTKANEIWPQIQWETFRVSPEDQISESVTKKKWRKHRDSNAAGRTQVQVISRSDRRRKDNNKSSSSRRRKRSDRCAQWRRSHTGAELCGMGEGHGAQVGSIRGRSLITGLVGGGSSESASRWYKVALLFTSVVWELRVITHRGPQSNTMQFQGSVCRIHCRIDYKAALYLPTTLTSKNSVCKWWSCDLFYLSI